MFLKKPLEFIYRKREASRLSLSYVWFFMIIVMLSFLGYALLSSGLVSEQVVILLFIPVVPVFVLYIIQGPIERIVKSDFSSLEWISEYSPVFLSFSYSEQVSKFLDGIYYGSLYLYVYSFILASVAIPVQMVRYVIQS